MKQATENICPECGNTVTIPNDRKVSSCSVCGTLVNNAGCDSRPTRRAATLTNLAILLAAILALLGFPALLGRFLG